MKKILNRVVASKLTWAAATLLLLYTLGGFLLAPYLLERYLPRYAEQHLERQASVGNISINPYLFTFDMSNFQLDGSGDSAMLKFKRLHIDFELSSIFRRAWTFADIRMEGFDLRLEIDREGRLNVMDVVERLQGPEQPDQPPPKLILEHLAVKDSSVHFSDLSGTAPASALLAPINLELARFSTMPDHEGRYILAVSLPAGGSLEWKGSVMLQPLVSSGEFSVKGLKLATAWQFLQDELRMAEPQGELAIAGGYGFSYVQGEAALGLNGVKAEISDLLVAPSAGSPALLALRSIQVSDARLSLEDRELVVPRLSFSDGNLRASRASDGTLDWLSLAAPKDAPEDAPQDAPQKPDDEADALPAVEDATQPWRVQVGNIGIEKVALAYTDYALSPGLVFQAGAINSNFKLDLTTGADSADSTEPPGAARVVVDGIQVALNKISVASTADDMAPLATLDSFGVSGGRLDTGARTALVENLAMSDGGMAIARGPDGPAGLLQWVSPAGAKSKEDSPPAPDTAPAAAAAPADETGAPWKYRVGSLELKQFDIQLADRGFTPPVALDVNVVSAAVENIHSASESPIVLATELRIGERGVINGSGTLRQDFGQAHGKLEANAISLDPLRPLVTRHAAADLKSGRVSLSAELKYDAGATPAVTAQGSARIRDFRLNEAGSEARLLSWKTLSVKKIALSLEPNRLAIEEVRLLEPGMKLVIDEDKNVNLKQVLKSGPPETAAATQRPAKKPAQSREGAAFTADVGQIRIVDGSLDFADLSLVLPFSTHVHALDGAIAGISTEPGSRAEIELAGQVETYGEASAAGMLIPEDPKRLLDILAKFDNIEMPPLSPYLATFAGRKIATGKLWLTLHYKIVDGNLEGENRIMLSDFKLGERVEAPDALDLPLDLAIGLLKSPDGSIELAVPVRGDLGNPQFDYGKVIRGALANVIRRIVTSPFRLLAGLLGEQDTEELRKVEFEPGSDDIAPAQREHLHSLAKALKARPEIALVVRGPYDAQRDGLSLRSERVQRDLAAAMGVRIKAGEDPGLIAYGDADTQKALEKLLAERAGSNAVKQFADEYAERTGRQPDRVNALLGIFGRGSDDHAFYAALFEHLVEMQPPLDNALQSLAANRAQAIIDVLREAGMDSRHLISGDIEQVTGEQGTRVAAQLSIDAIPDEP